MFTHPEWRLLITEYEAECRSAAMPPANPDRLAYDALAVKGVLTVLAVQQHETLAGFGTLVRSHLPHHSRPVSVVESLFVRPTWRASRAGLLLMRELERVAQEQGADAVVYSAPVGGPLAAILSRRRDYLRAAEIFVRDLRTGSRPSGVLQRGL
jgi:GNAT superfamily N-acetyltransferase